jgi:hypothetical protein
MNRKQFALILLALVIVGAAGLILIARNRQSWNVREAKVGDKVLSDFRFNDVAAIHIRSGDGEFNVIKKSDAWRVPERNDYLANYPQIKDLLLKMRELKVVQSDTIGPSQWGRVGLAEAGNATNVGTLLEFKDAGGKIVSALVVGKRHLRPQIQSDPFRLKGLFDGCYVRLPSDPENVLLISDDLAPAASEIQAWLDRSFVKIDHIKTVSLVSTNGANLWTLTRDTESRPWSLSDAAEADTLDQTAASHIAELLPFLTFIDVMPKDSPVAANLEKPVMLFVETFDQFFYTVKIGGPVHGGNYLLGVSVRATIPEGKDDTRQLQDKLLREQSCGAWVYVAEFASIEPLLPERSRLVQKKAVANQENFSPLQLSERQR